ncbi:MAG: hypothetical protein NDJ90_02925, partial [Oligoflexia bacterium]|nr:hypothetical protein [Oligoflexia bacterium]
MALPLAKKLALIAGTSVMVTAVAVGFVSGNSLEQELATRLRRETSDTARGLASRVRNELHGVSHPARLLAQAALERSGDPSVQLAFLKERFSGQKDLIAFSLHHRLDASWGWTPVFRVSRPGAPVQLSQQDFRNLDLRHPLDLSVLEKGGLAVSAGLLAGELPILRIAIPLPKKSDSVITHALTLELSQERLNSVLAEASAVSSLLLDEDRRVLAQTRAWGLSPGERLAEDPRQRLQGPEHFSGFEPVGLSGLWVVTHTTRAPIVRALWNWAGKVSWSALACLLAALALASALGGPSETAAPRERRAPTPEPERETLEAGAPDAPKLPARGIIVA